MLMLNSPGDETMTVGHFRKVPVVLGRSWPFLVVMLAFLLMSGQVLTPRNLFQTAQQALVWGGVLVLSTAIHEVGHLLAAQALRVPVRRLHLDVWGGHLTHMPVPQRPGTTILIAMAGPLANLAVAYVAWLYRDAAALSVVVAPVMVLNLALFVYNMLPGLPQDGGHLVSGAVWWLTRNRTSGMEVGAWAGRFVVVTAAVAWLAVPLVTTGEMSRPVDLLWLAPTVTGMWLWTSRILRVARRRRTTDRIWLRDVAKPTMTVPAHTRLDIVDASFPAGSGVIVLNSNDVPVGLLAVGTDRVPDAKRDVRSAGDVMTPMKPAWVCSSTLEGGSSDESDVLHEHNLSVVAVQLPDDLWGLVWRADLEAAMARHESRAVPAQAS